MKVCKATRRTPKGAYSKFKERTKNDVGIDHGCDLEVPQPHFLFFFLLLLLNFTKSFQYLKAEPLPLAPSCLFIGNEGTWLICSSPRRAVASTWSNLARPGDVVTSPLSYLGIFHILIETENNLSSCIATGVEQLYLDHMTGDITVFDKYSRCHDHSIVQIADGTLSKVFGKGSVVISEDITLDLVLYVPKLDCNLLSISKLTNNLNCVIKFSPNVCVFSDFRVGEDDWQC